MSKRNPTPRTVGELHAAFTRIEREAFEDFRGDSEMIAYSHTAALLVLWNEVGDDSPALEAMVAVRFNRMPEAARNEVLEAAFCKYHDC